MTATIQLTPEEEEFARACVESGRYETVGDVLRSGLALLQEQIERRKAFDKMIAEVREEGEREGYFTLDEVLAEMDAVIAGEKE
ncbi:antitoxin ParD1/3/4 [Rhizomicrobium palustre]|uniref:Antitoxin ParD1/3/4 n=1 Tax=Rhizomicrobium palustre TaxID=189966 RepID=A0A846MUJ4_9PROT|nr:type II toxin-antitoxin system ParD family antitoxin [Rhizomicrobium palustre]NIK87016.1 antitoxin ParD1/3/4 [Rhizomicrobium palustre]